jgi:nicotinate-nucleotide adenylyltransferase
MKIGLYFGSFNPIHVGHLIIASFVADNTDVEQVWIIVSPQSPLKQSSTLLNEYDRLHLVQLAVEGDPRLKPSDIEFKLPRPSFTIDTLTYLTEKYPAHQFAIIMGSDSFSNLPKWKNWELILKNYPIYVYLRPGFAEKMPHGTSVVFLQAPLLNISATTLRETIKRGRSIKYLVPERVEHEIERNNYYRLKL